LFGLGQRAYTRQPFGKSLADFRGSIVGARPKVRNEDHFPFEAKQGHYLVKIFHKWDDLFLCTITKDCDGKFDGYFSHWLTGNHGREAKWVNRASIQRFRA
jgi:hypothetical protein